MAMEISDGYGISYWDALIASVIKENSVSCIITEDDKDFKKIPWLTAITPSQNIGRKI